MPLWMPRLLQGMLAVSLGGAVGYLVGWRLGVPGWGAWFGAMLGVAVSEIRPALKAHRLIEWLRGAQDQPAPRDTGLWGEIGYRIERALRSRDRLLEQEAARLTQFLSAIEVSPNGVLMLDRDEQIEWCNSVAADHFGLDPQRDRRQRMTNLVRAPVFVAYLQEGVYDEPVSFVAPGGETTLSVLVRPYGDGLRLVLSQDVTERLRSEAMRRDFVANVSHEIRTPLTVLAGFIETLQQVPLTEVERARVLNLMGQQTTRMQTLVDDLLTLAKLEGSPRPPADRWVPVSGLLARVAADARALSAGRHDLKLVAPEEAATTQLAGHEGELLSAMLNVVSNAVRYTPEGGRIEVGWRPLADGRGEFAVVDSGIGVAREHIPRLTERFYRVDGSRSRETGGTGLGLSIVKHVLQRHGAELAIDSEPGRGSSFRLLFPAARVRRTAAAPVAQLEDQLPART